jgi:hypothetical protein
VIQAFAAAHQLPEVTVVGDAGMESVANLTELEDAGLRFIVGARNPPTSPTRSPHGAEPIPIGRSSTGKSSPSLG